MCTVAIGVISAVAQSVVSFAGAQENYEMRAAQWTQNYKNALAAGRDEQRQLSLRMLQEEEALSQAQKEADIEMAEISAEAEVSAASAGVSGVSLDNILTGIGRDIERKKTADETNHLNRVAQLSEEMKATNTRIENRIGSIQRPRAPNPLGYVFQGIGGALKAAQAGNRRAV